MICTYYQCTNTDCKFRFPAYERQSYEIRCPLCKSPVTIMTSVEVQDESNNFERIQTNYHIEAVFDNIRSALNVGSMFRTADGFGIKQIYLCGITQTPDTKNVSKSSLGAEKKIRWTYDKNSVDRINTLKDQRYLIVSIEEHNIAENIFTINQQRLIYPLVLVVGNEICGVDPDILILSDLILTIPMSGIKRSLNVAVAFGIAVSILHYSCKYQINP
jgi:23S rRNA (guanosine2251-2'-O)-methyltransferase